jgi:hypothetical protein
MHRYTIALLSTLAAVAACSQRSPTAPDSERPTELRAAPTTVAVGGKTLTVQTALWRDFMPVSPPDGKPLIAVAQVRTSDGSAVPEHVRADAIWVLHGTEMWMATPIEERTRAETAPSYEVVARDGPKWGPDVTVDVVLRLRDASGQAFLLRAPNQRIRATH